MHCTSAAFLGSFFREDFESEGNPRIIERFANRKGLKKLEEWLGLVKKHPEFAESPMVKVALSDWRRSLEALGRKKVRLDLYFFEPLEANYANYIDSDHPNGR